VSLKGLPPNDTLVLVDGRRMPATPFNQVSTNSVISFVDLNTIPLAAVDRIEVLNDGGSATYGADAIAGVVNVVLKDEYMAPMLPTTTALAKEATMRRITGR
jgi:iron complex outermembrane receptor protein